MGTLDEPGDTRPHRRRAATMADVATRAGVSVTTVSFVVNGTKRVSPRTAARVQAAMQDLHYQRNALARALASQRSHILALLFPALDRRLGRTDLTFITAAVTAAARRGYHLVIWPIGQDAGQLAELLAARLADGVLVMEVTLEDARVALLRQSGVPFTMIGRTRDLKGLSYVDVDFELATSEALAHMRSLGHTRIALVLEDLDDTPMRDYGPHVRVRSTYEEEMRKHRLDPQIVYCRATSVGGRQAAREILEHLPETTAVVALGDDVANGILNELHRQGRRVPGDLSVLVLASSAESAATTEPNLSFSAAPGTDLGILGANALIDLVEGGRDGSTATLLDCAPPQGDTVASVRQR